MRRMFMLLLMALPLANGCEKTGTSKVPLGEYCYEIPRGNILNSSFKRMLDDFPVDRSVAEVSIRFSAGYVAENVPGYAESYAGSLSMVDAELRVIFAALSPENLEYIESGVHYEDLWRGTGSYSEERLGQEVEWDETAELFRVSRAKISRGWTFTDVNPRQVNVLPPIQSVIGGCRERDAIGKFSYSCLHKNIRGNLLIEYWVPKENFPLYREIDDFVYAELENWKIGPLAEAGCLPKGS